MIVRERLEKFRTALLNLDRSVDDVYSQGWLGDKERDRIEKLIDQEIARLGRALDDPLAVPGKK